MKIKYYFFLFLVLMISACNKQYKYIEVVEDVSILGTKEKKEKEPDVISAESDSIAYLDAYRRFCISVKTNMDLQSTMGTILATPIEFKLLNDNDEDITNSVSFHEKVKIEKEIEDRIFSMKNTFQESIENEKRIETENFKKTNRIDSAKVKELEKFFRKRKDEFSNNNLVWYKPKAAPKYINMNGMYCYFQTENGMPSNLRFTFQYYSDDWLFFSKIQFSIDGKAYEYIPSHTDTDSGDGGHIWEWFDEKLSDSERELIYALSNAKSAKIKIIGKQYFDTQTISQSQIKSIKRTLELYQALGGKY